MSSYRPSPGAGACLAALLVIIAVAIAMLLLVLGMRAHAAGDAQKWGHDSETSDWFRNLHNPGGFPCCDYADGNRIEDPDYSENEDGSYEVNVAGRGSVHVPKEKVVTATNRVGYAIIWWNPSAPDPYCFLPGARG